MKLVKDLLGLML